MNTFRKFGFILSVSLLLSSTYAAYLKNVPQVITQPDGTIIHCFASGDEFHNWLHDSAGFTIIQNPQTGYYVYADLSGEELIASQYIVGKVNPASVNLRPEMNISAQAWREKRDAFFADIPVINRHKAKKNEGHIHNLVFFIRFADQTGFSKIFSSIESIHNDSSSADANSMYNYYRTISYGKMYVTSHLFPTPDGDVVLSYQDFYPRSYYSPKTASNPNGYDYNNKNSRKTALLQRVIEFFQDSVPTSIDLDYDNDGNIDNVCFLVAGNSDGWNDLLWPHRSWLYGVNESINGKRVWDYNFLLENHVSGPGTITHEMMHSMDAPDLYHYNYSLPTPVGIWDLMASTASTPQGLGAYMKYKYGGWIDEIPIIDEPGTYTLYPANGNSSEKTAYIIYPDPWYSSDEFLVLEYRNTASNIFENNLPGSGIVIYRINDLFNGNSGYDGKDILDEVYIFRPNGTITVDGSLSQAHFAAGTDPSPRTEFNLYTSPYPFYSKGKVINNVLITNITEAGDSIQFTITMDEQPNIYPNPLLVDCKEDYRTSFCIVANSDESWTISEEPSWIQVLPSKISGKGSDNISVRVTESYNGKVPRVGYLRIKSYSFDEKLTIGQCPCGWTQSSCENWLSIQEIIQNSGIKIFPNPAQSQFTVTNTENASLYLYNILGQEVLRTDSKEENIVINVNSLPQGVYVLKVVKNGISSKYKIIKN